MNTKAAHLYEIEIKSIKKELATMPEGHLTKKASGYYLMIGTFQKGITKDQKKVRILARKAYLLRRLKHLEWNLSLVKKNAARYLADDPVDIIKELPSFYQTLPIDYFFHPSVQTQIEQIDAASKNREIRYPENLIYLTNSGIRVRSKSERIIADMLYQNNVPFRYEAALVLGGTFWTPDFVIFRPSDGKVFLWEHFGLMDDEGYRQNMSDKLAYYARNKFYPFDNLICTYEQDMQSPDYIQSIIALFLLY